MHEENYIDIYIYIVLLNIIKNKFFNIKYMVLINI